MKAKPFAHLKGE